MSNVCNYQLPTLCYLQGTFQPSELLFNLLKAENSASAGLQKSKKVRARSSQQNVQRKQGRQALERNCEYVCSWRRAWRSSKEKVRRKILFNEINLKFREKEMPAADREKIKAAILQAKTLEEVEMLQQQLQAGKFPFNPRWKSDQFVTHMNFA